MTNSSIKLQNRGSSFEKPIEIPPFGNVGIYKTVSVKAELVGPDVSVFPTGWAR